MARSARLAKPEAMPTRFEGGDRGQVHWTCGLGSLNRGAKVISRSPPHAHLVFRGINFLLLRLGSGTIIKSVRLIGI